MNESPGALELLSSRVDELEKRVRALEHPGETRSEAIVQPSVRANSDAGDNALALETGGILPMLGRAMLGVAGAYVLRAIAEAGVSPKLPVSVLAVVYAFGWLAWSSRASAKLERAVYAGTSALVLAPLLWENTLKFHVFTTFASAAVLASFIVLATLMELRDRAKPQGVWVAQSVAAMTAGVLAFAAHQIPPFVAALLVAVLVSEIARAWDFAQAVWPLMVLITDAAIWAQIFIYAGPPDARTSYPELSTAALIAPACVLFAINGAGIVARVVQHQIRISVFETIQVMIAFLLALAGVRYFATQFGSIIFGVCCLALAACLYLVSFFVLDHREDRQNFRVFSAWSSLLLVTGSLWVLPHLGAVIVLGVAAVAATSLSRRMEAGILELQGAAFLITAIAVSGFPRYIFDTLVGSLPRGPGSGTWIIAICAMLASLVTRRASEAPWQRALQSVSLLLAVSALVALLVHSVVAGTALAVTLGAHHVAFLRTFTICLTALALAFSGSRWGRDDLTHMAYVVLSFVAAKLLFEDLRHGHMEFMAASIAVFAVALIAAPRLVTLGGRLRAGVRTETPVPTNS